MRQNTIKIGLVDTLFGCTPLWGSTSSYHTRTRTSRIPPMMVMTL